MGLLNHISATGDIRYFSVADTKHGLLSKTESSIGHKEHLPDFSAAEETCKKMSAVLFEFTASDDIPFTAFYSAVQKMFIAPNFCFSAGFFPVRAFIFSNTDLDEILVRTHIENELSKSGINSSSLNIKKCGRTSSFEEIKKFILGR